MQMIVKSNQSKVMTFFTRHFTRGILAGLTHHDKINHVDRWHAAQWIKGIRRNTRKGVLDYKLIAVETLPIKTP